MATKPEYEVGDVVKAFHPGKFGVIHEGKVVAVGNRWYSIDFGPLLNGRYTVDASHVTGKVEKP